MLKIGYLIPIISQNKQDFCQCLNKIWYVVRNRLIQSKTLPIEEANIKDLHPVIKSKIDAIVLAYGKKQERARLYSEKKREKKPIDEQPQAVDSDDSEGEELNEIINGKPKTINFESIDEMLNDFHKKFGM